MGTASTEPQLLKTLLERRHSTRAFLPEPLPDDLVGRMFALAQSTASWCNVQPWQLSLLSGEAAREFGAAFKAHAAENSPDPDFPPPAAYNGVYQDRRRQSGYALYASVGIARDDYEARTEQALLNYSLFGAPHAVIIHTDRDLGVYGAVDCGGYLATLMLAAESLGIATVAQAALAMYPDFVRDYLGLGPDRLIVAGMSFGREDTEHPINSYRVPREAVERVVERVDAPARSSGR